MKRRRERDSPLVLLVVGIVAFDAALALALATSLLPIEPGIVPRGLQDAAYGTLVGVGFWVVAGLLGSFRVVRLRGHGVLTFHLPFIVAAMALGGPVAAGWVGLLGTFERRELREAPWYGVVHNHSVMALAGVLGGLALVTVGRVLAPLGLDDAAVQFVGVIAGTAVFAVVSVTLVAITVALRDELTFREVLYIHALSYRDTAVAEAVLGWLLAVVYVTVGWWAPIACAALVITLWRANVAIEDSRTDPMTGLANAPALYEAVEDLRAKAADDRGGFALLFIDLNGLGILNNTLGHWAGDVLIRSVGDRVPACVRRFDTPGRLGGDEFLVVLRFIDDVAQAVAVARRIQEALGRPIAELGRHAATVDLSASVGVLRVDASIAHNDARDLIGAADAAMYRAKRAGKAYREQVEPLPTGVREGMLEDRHWPVGPDPVSVATEEDLQTAIKRRLEGEQALAVATATRPPRGVTV